MRLSTRQKQKIWYASVTETRYGIDTVQSYSNPEEVSATVSTTAGATNENSAGIIPEYDRYINYAKKHYDDDFALKEGMACWIDVVPKLNLDGSLVIQEDGMTPVTPPDYRVKKVLDTQKGEIARYGIAKIGGSD